MWWHPNAAPAGLVPGRWKAGSTRRSDGGRLGSLLTPLVAVTDASLGLLVLLALAAGCAHGITPEALKADWEGRPASALEKKWGPATRETKDGELRVLVYEEVEGKSPRPFEGAASAFKRGAINSSGEDKYLGPTLTVRSYLFWVNPQGTIVHTDVRLP